MMLQRFVARMCYSAAAKLFHVKDAKAYSTGFRAYESKEALLIFSLPPLHHKGLP